MTTPPDVSAAAHVAVPVGTAVEILYACAPAAAGGTAVVAARGYEKLYLWRAGYITLDTMPQAEGAIVFTVNPSDGDWIELKGVRWTFKATVDGDNQTQIGANLLATLNALVTDLNDQTASPFAFCTYSLTTAQDGLKIVHDSLIQEAEAFTLGASAATPSGPTLAYVDDQNAYGNNVTLTQKGADGLLAFRQLKRQSAWRGDSPVWSASVSVPEAE